jgi:hypothetical protein
MKIRLLNVAAVLALLVAALPASAAGAANGDPPDPIPVDISAVLKHRAAPPQPSTEPVHLTSPGSTSGAQCGGGTTYIDIVIPSFDAANPGDQTVRFFQESVGASATLWVAWDFLITHYGRQDVITCDQLTYLQSQMDSIVQKDTYYFGDYVERPAGNTNIDVMIFNIVDESFFDPTFGSYIAGFFWGSLNEAFDRNMIFVDSFDWANRLGATAARPYLYEGTVAHELQHLIHNDHDPDEDSWVDEGMADLAIYLNGFGHPDSHVVYYMAFHRTPLTVWGGGLESYGASYLFQLYLLENYGQMGGPYSTGWDNTWTRHEIDEQGNSIAGVEAATGAVFNNLYDSWIVANYLDDPSQTGAGGFPIGYNEINLAPYHSNTYGDWSIERSITDIYGAGHKGNLPTSRYYGGYISGTVEYPTGDIAPYAPVYGLYKGFEPELGLYLRGNAQSGVAPKSGGFEAASGNGNELTDRTLVLQTPIDTTGGVTLNFATWFDIEEEWDYGFVEVSDNGGPWFPIPGSITRFSTDPNSSGAWANSLISGQASSDTVITGNSGGWVNASFNLPSSTSLAIRFNYYTDEAVNGQGWFIDDVSVDGISDGFESGDGSGWDLGGWQVTSGQFNNDWIAGFVNPVYDSGQFQSLDWGYMDGSVSGPYEIINGVVDTSHLNKDQAVVFFANRPGSSPFAAHYLELVAKGNASP